jgi:hypothetical protein
MANTAISINNQQLMGAEQFSELKRLYKEIDKNGKAVEALVLQTVQHHIKAGNILLDSLAHFYGKPTLAALAEAVGFPQSRVSVSLRLAKYDNEHPGELDKLPMTDALRLIAERPPKATEGYNRVEFGGSTGQREFDFEELFAKPTLSNIDLKNYRIESPDMNNIMLIHRDGEGHVSVRQYSKFYDDVPQEPELRYAYKKMVDETQSAIEAYFKAKEIAEGGSA